MTETRGHEATEAAERRAQELGMSLFGIRGTGSGGSITLKDVNDAHERLQAASLVPVLAPKEQAIVDQYNVLRATLAGPETRSRSFVPDFSSYPDLPEFVPHPPVAEWYLPDPSGYHSLSRTVMAHAGMLSDARDRQAEAGTEPARPTKEEA